MELGENMHLIFELTNRCNLKCAHCLRGRQEAWFDLPFGIIEKTLREVRDVMDIQFVSFTGGEPTLHPRFAEIVRAVSGAGFSFGFITNGWNFTGIYPLLRENGEVPSRVTFSLDGAREETHDLLRGEGSYRRVMQAVSICVLKDIPFSFSTTVTGRNREEIEDLADLAGKLGSDSVRFACVMPTPSSAMHGLDLAPYEHRAVEELIERLNGMSPISLVMGPGRRGDSSAPCGPLRLRQLNIDWHGNLSLCCNLSSSRDGADIAGHLGEMSFEEAHGRLRELVERFCREEREGKTGGKFADFGGYPCWHCFNYFKKLEWLRGCPENPWVPFLWKT